MQFAIRDDIFLPLSDENAVGDVGVFTASQWLHSGPWQELFPGLESSAKKRQCKIERHFDYIEGTFWFPSQKESAEEIHLTCRMDGERICILENSGIVEAFAQEKSKMRLHPGYQPLWFLGECLNEIIRDDLEFLESVEEMLEEIEERILMKEQKGVDDQGRVDIQIFAAKKRLLRFYKCYEQLQNAVEDLLEDEDELGQGAVTLRLLSGRAARLKEEVKMLLDTTTQLQEIYRAQIEMRQNKIMNTLTIVTTIFLPLTLIVGWYGMNFDNMPELHWWFSYPIIIVISAAIVAVCFWYFKRKKYL